jgi:predicted Ser/Thr protein kinase
LAPFFALYAVDIHSALPHAKCVLITGGNNKLRVMDLRDYRVWSILKTGFDRPFVQREIEVRQTAGFGYAPALRAVAQDGTWFEEEYLDGAPLNRLSSKQERRAFIAEACTAMLRWHQRTAAFVDAREYVAGLIGQIETLLDKAVLLDARESSAIRQWIAAAASVIDHSRAEAQIALAMGHGDFQDGNIIVGRNRIWLIDWEYAGLRQSVYDFLVYLLRSRFPHGFAERIRAAVSDPEQFYSRLPVSWKSDGCDPSSSTLRWRLGIFLLEELHVNLEENANPQFLRQSGAWLSFRNEMWPALRGLDLSVTLPAGRPARLCAF